MWALRRRIEIIGIIIGAILLVAIPYWVTHRAVPSCTDGKQNQAEVGVDCGGPCTLLCKGQAQDIHVLWTKVFGIHTGVYDVVAYVENPNFNIAAPQFTYTARLYDENGEVIATRIGQDYALPSERFAIFAGGMQTGEKRAVRGSLEIAGDFQWFTTKEKISPFSVTNKVLTNFQSKPKLNATLHNDSVYLYRDITVATVIYDSLGEVVGVSSTKVDKIDGGGQENLSFTWPNPFSFTGGTEQCDVPVDVVLLLDRSGSMASEGKNPPMPFTLVRDATSAFVDFLSRNDHVGMVSFSTTASNPVDVPLTDNFSRAKTRIETTAMGTDGIQYTNTGEAISRAVGELATQRAREEARKVIVLLTDGESLEPNRPQNPKDLNDKNYPKQYAITQATDAKTQGILLYTIGLGVNANDEFLKTISTSPGHYYPSPSVADLKGVYKQIATSLCQKGPSVIEIIPRTNAL
jgi:hypothetical protein